jgi:hypothetical protein
MKSLLKFDDFCILIQLLSDEGQGPFNVSTIFVTEFTNYFCYK